MDKDKFFATFTKPDEEINKIKNLINRYGENATLKEVYQDYKMRSPHAHLPYKCPKCHGEGYLVTEYNGYPTGLPDSGWVYEPAYDYRVCDLCQGKGYTLKEYKPITETKIVGYETETE